MPSSPHPYRSAAHQLQHPEHASFSPSSRSSPLYTSASRKSHAAYRNSPGASSPEVFSDMDRAALPSAHISASRPYNASVDPSQQQQRPSPSKRRKQSSDGAELHASSSSNTAKTPPGESAGSDGAADSKPSTRVAKACQPCSTKKRRCDGRQPQCSVCQVLGTPCTYNHTGLKRGPPKGFRSGPKESARAKLIRTLETTIRDLVNHLGKDDAGAEIVRVSGERELPISNAQALAAGSGLGDARASKQSASAAKKKGAAAAQVKVEEGLHPRRHPSGSFEGSNDVGADVDPAAEAEEDVIGETRQGEIVYRGSSSGIGILQRQHRAESPSPAIAASRSVASGSSAPFGGRSRDDRATADLASHPKPPVFLPISSPHIAGDADTTSSQDRSPGRSGPSQRKDSSNLHSLYPDTSRDGQMSGSSASVQDPVVSVEENDRLFRYYWQGFHPFYPILYKPWFMGFSGEELRASLEPSLLYAIYSIAACVVPANAATKSDQGRPAADALNHERAQSFCQAAERHVLAKGLRPDIASIQTCWLLSLYSHGTGDLSRAWNFQNLASSMAVDMGLHRWPIYRAEIVQDRVQRETRIRIIWHCYILDKVLCAEMGRPVGLRAKDIDVPLLSETEEDEFELWSDQLEMQPAGASSSQRGVATANAGRRLHAPSCLNWGVHLFKIVERILDEVHSLRRKALLRRQGKEQVLAELDHQLTEWKEKLPAHLHLDDSPNEGPFPSFFALNLWYYTGRLLLHRPFIPQEEGLPMSTVLDNDSHRQSTLAANTICDLLEASARDIVDRLSTDLGYCLFTAAVMFVFNARLPDARIASDARRRYGLCVQWLKKLADTWPAASAHRLLLDGFAVVGEDASKQGGDAPQRRASIAALQAANAGSGMAATSKVSSWIAETEGALQGSSSARRAQDGAAKDERATTSSQDASAMSNANGAMGPGGPGVPIFDESWSKGSGAFGGGGGPVSENARQLNAPSSLDFAPGIFDVESFFWNENATATGLMGMNFTPLPGNTPTGSSHGLNSNVAPAPSPGMGYGEYSGGIMASFGPTSAMQGAAGSAMAYANMQYSQAGRGGAQSMAPPAAPGQSRQPAAAAAAGGMYGGAGTASGVLGVSEGGAGVVGQPGGDAGGSGTAGAGMPTSPFAFNPTAHNIGEFWSMLELPPAFLQQ
ncbi:transcription factor cys6 [Moesziomyces aphidis]|uniref:Transcription factor cys6 n=1 Tax=Moesziomyces aphidis TaxID=84754 RepID=W3VJS3_MOEAP|nr:transcription factor cys6 [Moesziomyces aphidis]